MCNTRQCSFSKKGKKWKNVKIISLPNAVYSIGQFLTVDTCDIKRSRYYTTRNVNHKGETRDPPRLKGRVNKRVKLVKYSVRFLKDLSRGLYRVERKEGSEDNDSPDVTFYNYHRDPSGSSDLRMGELREWENTFQYEE